MVTSESASVNSVSKSVHNHTRLLQHMYSSISEDMAKMVVCALVSSCLDYANSVLYGTTQKNLFKLQTAQNLLACVVTGSFQSCSHFSYNDWLPVEYCTIFKIANITFRTLNFSQPAYLHSALHAHHSTHSLRLTNTNLL